MGAAVKYVMVFLAGLLVGTMVHGFITIHRYRAVRVEMRDPGHVLGSLSKSLDLSPDQQQKVLLLLKAQMPKTDAIRNEQRQKFQALRASFDNQLKPLLDQAQQKKLEALVSNWEAKEKEEHSFGCASGPVSAAAVTGN
jgi:hypothetical protein